MACLGPSEDGRLSIRDNLFVVLDVWLNVICQHAPNNKAIAAGRVCFDAIRYFLILIHSRTNNRTLLNVGISEEYGVHSILGIRTQKLLNDKSF